MPTTKPQGKQLCCESFRVGKSHRDNYLGEVYSATRIWALNLGNLNFQYSSVTNLFMTVKKKKTKTNVFSSFATVKITCPMPENNNEMYFRQLSKQQNLII